MWNSDRWTRIANIRCAITRNAGQTTGWLDHAWYVRYRLPWVQSCQSTIVYCATATKQSIMMTVSTFPPFKPEILNQASIHQSIIDNHRSRGARNHLWTWSHRGARRHKATLWWVCVRAGVISLNPLHHLLAIENIRQALHLNLASRFRAPEQSPFHFTISDI